MRIRKVPCPECRRVPVVEPMDQGMGFTVYCRTHPRLTCLGRTEEDAVRCWNHQVELS